MRRWLGQLRHGRELRHVPVAVHPMATGVTRSVVLHGDGSITPAAHVPMALHPLTFALWANGHWVEDGRALAMSDSRIEDGPVARIGLERRCNVNVAGTTIAGYRALSAVNGFDRLPGRWWTYALANRSARRSQHKPGGLGMTALELRALDCYYVWPRPVYLVSVAHRERSNIFPMDLVGPLGEDGLFTLALRNTSPSVATIRSSGRVVLSIAPAAWLQWVYALGAHHRQESVDPARLPFRLTRSRAFGLPVPEGVPGYREIDIVDASPVGSHTFFYCRTRHAVEPDSPTRQLAHVSGLFAAWRARTGAPLDEASEA